MRVIGGEGEVKWGRRGHTALAKNDEYRCFANKEVEHLDSKSVLIVKAYIGK
jgi:hypothetical protein